MTRLQAVLALVLVLIASPGFAQEDAGLSFNGTHEKSDKWSIIRSDSNGYVISFLTSYNGVGTRQSKSQYISIDVAKQYMGYRPQFISFTLPDNIDAREGLKISFDHSGSNFDSVSNQKTHESCLLEFNHHWAHNHTLMALIPDGLFIDSLNGTPTDIFSYFMHSKELTVSFTDLKKRKTVLNFSLSSFQEIYDRTGFYPVPYSTGIPADTALSFLEMGDKTIFSNGNSPSSWKTAGIDNVIELKHFVKYFKFLANHHEEEKIADLIDFNRAIIGHGRMSRREFISQFDAIFSPKLLEEINNQKLNEIFRNVDGVMIANCIWITEDSVGRFYIIAINCTALKG